MIISKASERTIELRTDGRKITRILDHNSPNNDSSINMLISRIPKGCNEILHYHKNSIEIFYCLSATDIIVNDETIHLNKGDTILLEPEDIHKIQATEPMELLVIKTPNIDDKVIVSELGK